ncbi:MAG: MotA/TolQ/ExbB proton channel family protein [Halothiobacillaceae bacterium]|nr:MotA/TolQ/ExbB proton channel family protein [Halothiobacillaceae bacterium]
MDLFSVFEHGDAVLVAVFVILALMSLATWAVAVAKLVAWLERARASRVSQREIVESRSALNLARRLQGRTDPVAAIAQAGLDAARAFRGRWDGSHADNQRLDEALIRGIRQALDRQEARVQAGQTLFASVGSLAPFVGLFGTVWGIHGALLELAAADNVTMNLVAGPLGEALVATAAGLAAAIPAVLFYNLYNRGHRLYAQVLEANAHDVHALLMHDPALGQWAGGGHRNERAEPVVATAVEA